MSSLSVSLDMVGVLREAGSQKEPDPAQAALMAELSGADGITVQLRRDRKYIRDRDLYILKNIVKTKLGVEIPPIDDIIDRAVEVKPHSVTIVADLADSDSPVTTVDFHTGTIDFSELTTRFKGVGVQVNFFIEPEIEAVRGAIKSGADGVMLSCSAYSDAANAQEARSELDRIDRAAQAAAKQGIDVYAGRGINYRNVGPLVELENFSELIIGRAICVRAMLIGFDNAVREMKQAMDRSRRASGG